MGIVDALRAALGPSAVIDDPPERAAFETDYTGRFSGRARVVVRPTTTAAVATAVQICAEHGAPIVTQGGNTGLVGASVPREGEVLLSTRALRAVEPVDAPSAQLIVGAGATLETVQTTARSHGLDAGLDFAARGSATVGGVVATNAGGARALRYGTARARVTGMEAVLADGSVVARLGGVLKDNAGYDLPALLIGSEGTLGITTAIRWQLVPRFDARVAALVPLASIEDAAALLARLRRDVASLEAADFLLDDGLALVLSHLRITPSVPRRPVYVLIECAARTDPSEELLTALGAAGNDDAVLADDDVSRRRLWQLREALPEAIAGCGIAHKMDVGVPLGSLADFLRRVPEEVACVAPRARVILFGHLGDGNVHVNVLGNLGADLAVDERVLRLAISYGGTISAEHGVGTVKSRWLELLRGADEVRAMIAIKRALDPQGLLNPGAVLPCD